MRNHIPGANSPLLHSGWRDAAGSATRRIGGFFAAVPGSLKNHLNGEELFRITVTAVSAGGGVFGLLSAFALHADTIFPAPADAALAALIIGTILDARRRLGHGAEPSPNRLGRHARRKPRADRRDPEGHSPS